MAHSRIGLQLRQLRLDLGEAVSTVLVRPFASGLYRLFARRMRGYTDAQAHQIFRDLLDMPADVTITDGGVHVHFHRRAHLPIIIASGLLDQQVTIPWWKGLPVRMTA
jgi:hypothetical protein